MFNNHYIPNYLYNNLFFIKAKCLKLKYNLFKVKNGENGEREEKEENPSEKPDFNLESMKAKQLRMAPQPLQITKNDLCTREHQSFNSNFMQISQITKFIIIGTFLFSIMPNTEREEERQNAEQRERQRESSAVDDG